METLEEKAPLKSIWIRRYGGRTMTAAVVKHDPSRQRVRLQRHDRADHKEQWLGTRWLLEGWERFR